MKRKVISIRTLVAGDPDWERVLVLCDDGSVWFYDPEEDRGWVKMQDIPDAPEREPTPDEAASVR